MANIPIWEGTSNFVPGLTAYHYFDNDPVFQNDADNFATYAARRLGYPIMDVELQDIHFYAALEAGVMAYANELYKQKIADNYLSLEGSPIPSGSAFNGKLTNPSLGSIIRLAKAYGSEAGTGGLVTYYSGSVDVIAGKQNYDLKIWAQQSASLAANDSIEIKRIFHHTQPASVRWIDPYLGTTSALSGTMAALGWENMGQSFNYVMMPLSYDVARMQAIELNDEIRRSTYSFEIRNNVLRLFPQPTYDTKVWFEYIKVSERDNALNPNLPSTGVITDPSNVPYTNIEYSTINAPGKQWIIEYALACSKEILGLIRGKYSSIPSAGTDVMLNAPALLEQASREKDNLLLSLRDFFLKTSRSAQLERQQIESDQIRTTLSNIPTLIYVG